MTAPRVGLDRARCSGFGLCALYAPDVFALDASGTVELRAGAAVPAHLLQAVGAATRACPQRVITLRLAPPEAVVQH